MGDVAIVTHNNATSPELDAGWLSPNILCLLWSPSRGLGARCEVQKHRKKAGGHGSRVDYL